MQPITEHEQAHTPGSKSRGMCTAHYIGPGQWQFLATVSKLCKQIYEKVEVYGLPYRDADGHWKAELCTAKSTLLTAVFASVSRVQLAVACGLTIRAISNWRLQRVAGKRSSLSTLPAAHKLKLPLTHHVTLGAARSGSITKLDWLYEEQRQYLPVEIRMAAIGEGHVDVLK
eukprot:7993-Heterococcus_DN1.PRE.1